MQSNSWWMARAIHYVKTHNSGYREIPVCALVVKSNELISIACNQVESLNDPTAHAEILAIREASKVLSNWRLNGCTMYVTLEPCAMCMGAILNSRISKLVFGAFDLADAKTDQLEIIGGILEIECSELLKNFFALKRKTFYNLNMPSVSI